MKVICFLSEKGGQAKTSCSLALGTLFAQAGYRVLLIDGDSQAHLTIATRTPKQDMLWHLLINRGAMRDVVTQVDPDYYGGSVDNPLLYIIPSAEQTGLIDKQVDVYELRNRRAELEPAFDFAIVDTSPKIGQLHILFSIFADYLIYPTAMTYLPIQGLFASLAHRRDAMAEGYPVGEVMGILPTMYSKRKLQSQNLAALQKKYGEDTLFSPLRFLEAWNEASQLRVPINRLPYESDAGKEAERFAQEVLTRMGVVEHG